MYSNIYILAKHPGGAPLGAAESAASGDDKKKLGRLRRPKFYPTFEIQWKLWNAKVDIIIIFESRKRTRAGQNICHGARKSSPLVKRQSNSLPSVTRGPLSEYCHQNFIASERLVHKFCSGVQFSQIMTVTLNFLEEWPYHFQPQMPNVSVKLCLKMQYRKCKQPPNNASRVFITQQLPLSQSLAFFNSLYV